jgi:hypothetical protein
MAIQLLITDQALTVQGDPLSNWTSLDCTLKFNEPASGSVDLPATPDVMAQLQPGNRLVVIRDGDVWCAGPLEIPQDYSWAVTGDNAPPGRVTANFSDDLAVVAGYLTWPDPASVWASQPETSRQILTTNGETILRTLVNENCGPGAITARRIPGFALATAAGVGTTTSVNTRLEALLTACRRVAIDAGGLGFRTRQTSSGSGIEFEVYEPADLTASARFSAGLGNLRSLTYKQSAPTVTHALVTGTDAAVPRAYVEVADTAAASTWWRVEQLVDASADDDLAGELTQEGTSALASGAAPVELATVTVDTDDLRAGVDYGLGDKVTIELPTGLEVADLVRSINLTATPTGGEYVTSVVGSPDATTDTATVRLIRDLGRRLGRLEAR